MILMSTSNNSRKCICSMFVTVMHEFAYSFFILVCSLLSELIYFLSIYFNTSFFPQYTNICISIHSSSLSTLIYIYISIHFSFLSTLIYIFIFNTPFFPQYTNIYIYISIYISFLSTLIYSLINMLIPLYTLALAVLMKILIPFLLSSVKCTAIDW